MNTNKPPCTYHVQYRIAPSANANPASFEVQVDTLQKCADPDRFELVHKGQVVPTLDTRFRSWWIERILPEEESWTRF